MSSAKRDLDAVGDSLDFGVGETGGEGGNFGVETDYGVGGNCVGDDVAGRDGVGLNVGEFGNSRTDCSGLDLAFDDEGRRI